MSPSTPALQGCSTTLLLPPSLEAAPRCTLRAPVHQLRGVDAGRHRPLLPMSGQVPLTLRQLLRSWLPFKPPTRGRGLEPWRQRRWQPALGLHLGARLDWTGQEPGVSAVSVVATVGHSRALERFEGRAVNEHAPSGNDPALRRLRGGLPRWRLPGCCSCRRLRRGPRGRRSLPRGCWCVSWGDGRSFGSGRSRARLARRPLVFP